MIKVSSTIAHNHTVPTAGNVLTYTIPLKSAEHGDKSPVKSFNFRALRRTANNQIMSSAGSHTFSGNTLSMIAKRRPPLMHQSGAMFTVDTNGILFCEAGLTDGVQVGTINLLFRPFSGTVRIARGAVTVDITASGAVTVTGAATAYVNGGTWTGTVAFPYPRLVTIVYTAAAAGPIRISSSTGNATFYMQQFAWSTRILTSAQVQHHAALFYRKRPITISSGGSALTAIVTDTALTAVPTDAAVTLPETWITV